MGNIWSKDEPTLGNKSSTAGPEAGLTDEHIVNLSKRITSQSELVELGVRGLNLPEFIIDAAIYNKNEIQDATREVLQTWVKQQTNREESLVKLQTGLQKCEMNSLVAELRLWTEGRTEALSETRMYFKQGQIIMQIILIIE